MQTAHPRFNAQVYEEACEWFVEFRSGEPDAAARRRFHEWLARSPAHMGAYLEATTLWNEGAALSLKEEWTPEALIAAAREEGNVVSLAAPARISAAPREVRSLVKWRIAAAIGALGIAAALGWRQFFGDTAYSTAIAEQRSMVLPDGSTVALNARSKIVVRFSERERTVELLEGQALFNVTKDARRPFVVLGDTARVRVLGTEFDVNRTQKSFTVTVLQGRVAVSPESSGNAAAPTLLAAGERVVVAAGAVERIPRPNIALATAWTQRQLVFASTPLSQVAEEFNRYNKRQLLVRDVALETFEIDGVFSSTDPASLIRFLRERPGVRIIETEDEILIARQ